MSRFKNIDEKLEKLSTKLGAKLSKDRPRYPKALRTFEERRIDWKEGDIFKAIIIQPTFEDNGVNQEIWNLINIAWSDFNKGHRPQWMTNLVDKERFETIENNIDSLLTKSENNLVSIGKDDLK